MTVAAQRISSADLKRMAGARTAELRGVQASIAKVRVFAELESALAAYGVSTAGVAGARKHVDELNAQREHLEREVQLAESAAAYLEFEERCQNHESNDAAAVPLVDEINARIAEDPEADFFVRWRDGDPALLAHYGLSQRTLPPPPNPGVQRVKVREALGRERALVRDPMMNARGGHEYYMQQFPIFAEIYAARKAEK